jgi:hypothetical protein
MRSTELIEKFNEVLRLKQRAWEYDNSKRGFRSGVVLEAIATKHGEAEAAAQEFCQLLTQAETENVRGYDPR